MYMSAATKRRSAAGFYSRTGRGSRTSKPRTLASPPRRAAGRSGSIVDSEKTLFRSLLEFVELLLQLRRVPLFFLSRLGTAGAERKVFPKRASSIPSGVPPITIVVQFTQHLELVLWIRSFKLVIDVLEVRTGFLGLVDHDVSFPFVQIVVEMNS
jgi:hypothetical protein